MIQIPSPSDEFDSAPVVVEPVIAAPEVVEEIVEEAPITVHSEVEIIEIAPQPVAEPTPVAPVVELTASVIEIEGRTAEIDALCRDFLLVGSVNDTEDVNLSLIHI